MNETRFFCRALTSKELRRIRKFSGLELKRRWQEGEDTRERLSWGWLGFANFMAGVTWALACRKALRESKNHTPSWGVRPASGEMWLPKEIMRARGLHLARREWDPLCAQDWYTVRDNLAADFRQAQREAERLKDPPEVVKFIVPLVEGSASTIVSAELPQEPS